MTGGRLLNGTMIPRRLKRIFDARSEPRDASSDAPTDRAEVEWRGVTYPVRLANLSASGAMVLCAEIPHIGDAVVFRRPATAPIDGVIRWVGDGRIGIHFTALVE